MKKKIITIVSGGIDSITMLHLLSLRNDVQVVGVLSFDYGQRHVRELQSAEAYCDKLDVSYRMVDLSGIHSCLTGSALTGGGDVPEGHYADEIMKATVVPNRNMIMLSIAGAEAMRVGAEEVYYGAQGGNHTIYPDCRPEFLAQVNKTLQLAGYAPVTIKAPFINMTKGDIIRLGLSHKVDYSMTWTCYNGREKACGKCGSCVKRLEAFAENGVIDPLSYEG